MHNQIKIDKLKTNNKKILQEDFHDKKYFFIKFKICFKSSAGR